MDEIVHMRIDGKMAELLAKINPEKYKKFMTSERGKPVVYVRLKKALYRTLRAALLFWELLSTNLVDMGFQTDCF